MSDPVLIVERDPPIALVTLNRPEHRNALSAELRLAIGDAFRTLEADPEVHAAILTGAAPAFCAGMDLKELAGGGPTATGYERAVTGQREMRDAISGFSGALIAAVAGTAATAGFELALACDWIIAASSAKFLDTHARVGILPGWGLSVRLPRLIGIARAKELSLSGNAIGAQLACEWGLVNRVVEPDALLDTARALAHDCASCVPETAARYKRLIERGYSMPFDDALAMELEVGTESSKQIGSTDIGGRSGSILERGRRQTS